MSVFVYFVNAIVIFFLFFNSNFIGKKLGLIDQPDSFRKKHLKPTPVVGGLFFFLFIFLYLLLDFTNIYNLHLNIFFKQTIQKTFFLFSFFLIFVIGILDDRIDLKPLSKIIFYTLIYNSKF